MLKSLLAERFGLRVHIETRQAPVHVLTIARADGRLGPALKTTSAECEAQIAERKRTGTSPSRPPNGFSPTTPSCGITMMGMNTRNASATFTMGGIAFSSLVERVSSELGAPVVDRTGLTGLYDVVLEYQSTRRPSAPGQPPPGLDPNGTDSPPIPLPIALQQQLGLKLEKTVGPLPITIVDAADHPTAD